MQDSTHTPLYLVAQLNLLEFESFSSLQEVSDEVPLIFDILFTKSVEYISVCTFTVLWFDPLGLSVLVIVVYVCVYAFLLMVYKIRSFSFILSYFYY